MSNISIHKGSVTLGLKAWTYPAGEVAVRLDADDKRYLAESAPYQTIVARIQNAGDIVTLMMVDDALRRLDDTPVRLFMPYCPFGQQDRVCVKGESHSLAIFAGLINVMEFDRVTVLDPHSSVMEAVFDRRLHVINQLTIIDKWEELRNRLLHKDVILISPDSGSNKKTAEIAGYIGKDFIRADKRRNLATGEILETIVYADDLTGMTVAIIDDIGVGCATFTQLAKVLKAKGAASVILYITHAVLSKHLGSVLGSGIDELWTTDSYRTKDEMSLREPREYAEGIKNGALHVFDVGQFI